MILNGVPFTTQSFQDRVKKSLMAYGVQLEEFGGDIPAVHVSGLTGEGLPDLIETLSTVAEVRDLRADQGGPVYGHVIESNIHKGLGYATLKSDTTH